MISPQGGTQNGNPDLMNNAAIGANESIPGRRESGWYAQGGVYGTVPTNPVLDFLGNGLAFITGNDTANPLTGMPYYSPGDAANKKMDFFMTVVMNIAPYSKGIEFSLGENFRIAPWGNRTGNEFGELPHYHRLIESSPGKTVPGGSLDWHRPWQKGW